MNKATFEKAINKAKEIQTQYTIVTNIAVGRGINGVDFTKFESEREWDNRSACEWEFKKTTIEEMAEDHVVIVHTKGTYDLVNSVKRNVRQETKMYFIPYENIVSVVIKL